MSSNAVFQLRIVRMLLIAFGVSLLIVLLLSLPRRSVKRLDVAKQTKITQLQRKTQQASAAGRYAEGITAAKELVEILKADADEYSAGYAETVGLLARLYDSTGEYQRSEALLRETLGITEKVVGKESLEYRYILNYLAGVYYSMGEFDRAEPLYREVLQITAKIVGKDCAMYADSLCSVANVYSAMGDYRRAESLFREAMAIKEKVLGKGSREYAASLNNLAVVYASMGDYPRAERLNIEAMAIKEKVLGKGSREYAASLNNLADLYDSMGDYPRAEPLYRESLATKEKVLGKGHPDYAANLNNLAIVCASMGDYPQAELLYRQALEIWEKGQLKEHPFYANGLANLGALYRRMGDYPRAEPLFREAVAIREKVLGKEHPHYARSLSNLASLSRSMDDHRRAERLYLEAMAIEEKVLGKEHPDYARTLSNLAGLYDSMGDYRRAEPLYLEAMAIQEKTLGRDHPYYAANLNNLAGLYRMMNDCAQAEPLYRKALEITLRNLESTADVQSQRQQVRMGESRRVYLDSYLSLAVREPQFQAAAYGALLRWKGSVWQRQQTGRLLIDEPSLKPQFAALQQVSSKLSTLILRVPEPNQREAWRRQLDELTDEREKLERDLSLASVAFRKASTPVTPEQMRDSLPEGTMLLDFLEYKHYTPANQEQQTKESWERRLLVHLVRSDQEVRAIDLGPVAAIADLVQTWRRDLGGSSAAVDAAAQLRKRIWEPLAEHLSGITMVYVSPDGVLGQFPLAALPGKQPGSFLIEEIAIVILPVPQVLASMNQAIARADDAGEDRFCLVGGVDYDQVSSPTTPTQPTTPTSEPAVTGPQLLAVRGGEPMVFTPLPGTVGEIETIESLLQKHRPSAKTTILSGAQATEAAFSRVAPGNRYLHIATHGFFAPPTVKNALTAAKPEQMNRMLGVDQSRSPQLVGEHPDLLSGLVFAGANKPTSDEEDGILTAAEVQELDLRGVELAILSACETGLGATAGGEGIIGLQRAFQLAGVETTITSLWQVDDAATEALMVEFYQNLFERKLGKYESLRQAQLTMLNHYDATTGSLPRGLGGTSAEVNLIDTVPQPTATSNRLSPAYWAAFQLSGDWR